MKLHVIMLALMMVISCAGPQLTPTENIQECKDKSCFIGIANQCKPVEIILQEEAGTIKYTASNCIFTKTLVTANPAESQEVKSIIEGKSLKCPYTEGKFNQNWLKKLVFETESCKGELKDVLTRMIVFVE